MSRDERAGDRRRSFARGDRSASAGPAASAGRGEVSGRAPRQEGPSAAPRPRHAQMVFITPMGIPIGPSVQEELNIPDDLNDALPPGDFPGQLLLDLGLR